MHNKFVAPEFPQWIVVQVRKSGELNVKWTFPCAELAEIKQAWELLFEL